MSDRERPGGPDRDGLRGLRDAVLEEVGKVVVGQEEIAEGILAALVVGGHVLLEGVPGVAKSLLAETVARTLAIDFARVQFTPDMLPSDITGTMMLRAGELSFREGPIFTNVLLADEINRTPPKTQAALLEAMQEGQVSVEGESHRLPEPFLVLATQNPIDYEGTYPLPEAQLDRFVAKLAVGYPDERQERAMLSLGRRGLRSTGLAEVRAVAGPDDLARARSEVDRVIVSEAVRDYVVALVRRTRELPSVSLGASPRAAVHLLALARAAAALAGRGFVIPEDVAGLAGVGLRHRIVMSPEAELEQYTSDDAVRTALGEVPVPR
jgi:MoxR-like ATPase